MENDKKKIVENEIRKVCEAHSLENRIAKLEKELQDLKDYTDVLADLIGSTCADCVHMMNYDGECKFVSEGWAEHGECDEYEKFIPENDEDNDDE